MSEDRRTRLKRWLESGELSLQPLTFPQRELWEASPLSVADPSNHICTFIEVRGLLTAEDCHAAVQGVINRQEVMRLSVLPGKDQPIQMIRASAPPQLQFRHLSVSERHPEAVEELMQVAFGEPFDLVQGPLYRVNMLRRDADDHLLVLTIHHAIADGWSLGAFVKDLCAAYLSRARPRSYHQSSSRIVRGAPLSEPFGRVPRSVNIFPSGNLNWQEQSGY